MDVRGQLEAAWPLMTGRCTSCPAVTLSLAHSCLAPATPSLRSCQSPQLLRLHLCAPARPGAHSAPALPAFLLGWEPSMCPASPAGRPVPMERQLSGPQTTGLPCSPGVTALGRSPCKS